MSEKILIAKDIICPIYEKTNSINQTAKELNISWNACKRILLEYGYQTKPKNGQVDFYDLFREIKNEEDAYWLGVMYTDGWIRSDTNKIGLGSTDLDLIEKWKNYTKSSNKIQIKPGETLSGKPLPEGRVCKQAKDFYTLEFSSKQTKNNLINLGCVPAKSKILQCPTTDQVPDYLLFHFLRGLIDGDGWITYNIDKHHYSIGLLGTQHLLENLLTRARILHYGNLHKKEASNIWEFGCYKKENVEHILQLIYKDATIYMDRKHQAYLNFIGRSSI